MKIQRPGMWRNRRKMRQIRITRSILRKSRFSLGTVSVSSSIISIKSGNMANRSIIDKVLSTNRHFLGAKMNRVIYSVTK